ncbi:MAG TPA: hypothetical protein VKM94_08455 [Blastocatellia bacterium]|nr:hypothetical protein [Blastocatellia bacterium]
MRKKFVPRHLAFASFVFVFFLTSTARPSATVNKDHKQFAALSARLSEPGGYFDSDNLISNETSYLHVLGKLKEIGVSGGAYVGVGPDQNFSYIARIRPRVAIIIDIRRDNLLQHLMFKSLFGRARNRIEYLCLFFGKPYPRTKGWEQRSIKDLIDYVDNTPYDSNEAERTIKLVRDDVQKFGMLLNAADLETIVKIQRAFFSAGLDIRYSSYHRPPRSIYPTYRDLLVERDLSGGQQNYFNSEDDYQFLKKLEEQDLVIPVVGDLSGTQAMKSIGQYLKDTNERISAFYVSNVEFYLQRQGTYDRFHANLKMLPIDSKSVIIRSYFNYYAPPHPQAEPNHFSTQLLERIEDLLKQCDAGECESYQDIVTKNSILLH